MGIERESEKGRAEVELRRVTFFLSGRVQGVGMRYAINRLAQQFPVVGFVENLNGGRVRGIVEGASEHIDQFLDAIRVQGPGVIRRLDRFESPPTGEFVNFSIQR
jgi:acylphosphatase